jgi:hypothetical protein
MIMIARKFSLLRQLVWAATLATGLATLWLVLAIWLGTSIQGGWQRRRLDRLPHEAFAVKSDGTPLIQATSYDPNFMSTYRDLNGRKQSDQQISELISGVNLLGEHRMSGIFSSPPD